MTKTQLETEQIRRLAGVGTNNTLTKCGALLQNGYFISDSSGARSDESKFNRFTDSLSKDSDSKFPAEDGRYILYVAAGCPFAARPWLVHSMMGLSERVRVIRAFPTALTGGWFFEPGTHEEREIYESMAQVSSDRDPHGHSRTAELYLESNSRFTGRATLPVLYDSQTRKIVSNEPDGIARMLVECYWPETVEDVRPGVHHFFPLGRETEMREWTGEISKVNQMPFAAFFSTNQEEYEAVVKGLFSILDSLETLLAIRPYVLGPQPTYADVQLWPTLVLFDPVYHGHLRCSSKSLRCDYPSLWAYVRRMYALPGVADTLNFNDAMSFFHKSRCFIEGDGRTVRVPPSQYLSEMEDWSRKVGTMPNLMPLMGWPNHPFKSPAQHPVADKYQPAPPPVKPAGLHVPRRGRQVHPGQTALPRHDGRQYNSRFPSQRAVAPHPPLGPAPIRRPPQNLKPLQSLPTEPRFSNPPPRDPISIQMVGVSIRDE